MNSMRPQVKGNVTEAEARMRREHEHDFVLALTAITDLSREAEDALFEVGCDGATISIRSGRVFLSFSRSAASLREPVLGASRGVRRANVG